jgi:hypothetical protein
MESAFVQSLVSILRPFGSEIDDRFGGLSLNALHKAGYQLDGKADIVSVPVENHFCRCVKSHDSGPGHQCGSDTGGAALISCCGGG